MRVRGRCNGLGLFTVAGLVCLALFAPGGATAATVVNGNFESGDLAGWSVGRATGLGDWYAYEGTDAPIGGKQLTAPVPAPPQGEYAAITDELNPDTLILYQDIVLRPEYDHRLSLFAYYLSQDPIAVPNPDTLSVDDTVLGGQANQQYRIDVMTPSAPLESIDPADILRTVFRTRPGDPKEKPPTMLTADLSAFAGQTVRLRIANAAHEETFNAGLDAVAVASAPPGQLPPLKKGGNKSGGADKPGGSVKFSFGKVKANRSNGTAILPVRVPDAGKLSAKDASTAKASASKARKAPMLIKPATARATRAGTVKLRLRPTNAARGILELKQKLRVKVAVTYRPSKGKAETATVPVVLKLEADQRRQR
jgi:hypothetical protein